MSGVVRLAERGADKLDAWIDQFISHVEFGRAPSANTIAAYRRDLALWRSFCAEHGVPVETMPGDLDEPLRGQWDGFKEEELHSAVEGRSAGG